MPRPVKVWTADLDRMMAALAAGRLLRFSGEKSFALVDGMVEKQSGGATYVRWDSNNTALRFGWIERVGSKYGYTFFGITESGRQAIPTKGAGAHF